MGHGAWPARDETESVMCAGTREREMNFACSSCKWGQMSLLRFAAPLFTEFVRFKSVLGSHGRVDNACRFFYRGLASASS